MIRNTNAIAVAGLAGAFVAACGADETADPTGPGGAATTATQVASSSSTGGTGAGGSGTGGTGAGDTGAGGAGGTGTGGTGGAGGAGGSDPIIACEPATLRVATGVDFTCAVTSDGAGACRGGPFGNDWDPIQIVPSVTTTCVEAVHAGGDVACVRVGAGCDDAGLYCRGADFGDTWVDVGLDGPLVAITGGDVCTFTEAGVASCTGAASAPSGANIAPLGGAAGGARDTCVWGVGGITCGGETAALASDVPAFPGCPADVAVGDGYACAAYSGIDVVDCWGELPRGIPPRFFLPAPGADVTVGAGFVCVRTSAGIVRCLGDNAGGGLGVPGLDASTSGVEPQWPGDAPEGLAIAAGPGHVALLTDVGAVLAWGDDDAGQVCDCSDGLVTAPVDATFHVP